jgi:peptidase M28-like protein/PDZ domain-containing protein/PA domain-containing protein
VRVRTRLLLAALLVAAAPAWAAAPVTPSAAWLVEQVKILSAPDMEGRASGTPAAARAARHIAAELQRAGVKPGGDDGTWEQAFTVSTGIRLGESNALRLVAPAPRALVLGRDFVPLTVSADGALEGDVVFAGYGITAPDVRWDDYAGLDVRGRVVLVLEGEPRRADPAGPFRRPDAYHYVERSHKVINAREHGAAAVLLVAPTAGADTLPPLTGIGQPWSIFALAVSRGVADAMLAPAGVTLAAATGAIDAGPAPRSFAVNGARVALQVALVRERGRTANVVGILPGRDTALREETVLIGAHYDHLGRGGEGSLAPDALGTVHPGADDNASGVAAVLGLARAFAAAGGAPRTLVFVAFTGEEMGLLGSTHYVRHPARPLERTVLMVNLDMVGRLRDRTLYVGGVDGGRGLRELVSAQAGGLSLALRGDPFGPSDHTAFYSAGRPVLFLFTGAHADYHRPGDTWDKINGPGLAEVTAFAARVVDAVATAATPPVYVRITAPPTSVRGGYGPFFGVVPEFGERAGGGVRVGDVRAGSPAETAGVRAGDVIVTFAGMRVETLQDFSFALSGRRAGDRVDVVVVRDGAERRLEAVLAERK